MTIPYFDEATIAWINVSILVLSSILFTIYYVKSVQPAALEQRMGSEAYQKCAHYRFLSGLFMFVASGNFLVYYFYPLAWIHNDDHQYLWSIPQKFLWPYYVSVLLATMIAVPCGLLFWLGMNEAGEETMTPKKEHKLYGGIYNHMRHPQAAGEGPLWIVMALLEHSPVLTLLSCLVYGPIWYYFCVAEERDLVLRYGSTYEEYQKHVGILPKIKLSWIKGHGKKA